MPVRKRSDISNAAVSMFFGRLGALYDKARNLEPLTYNVKTKESLLREFNNRCSYCGKKLNIRNVSLDHLVGINKFDEGLHAWGNVVPSCALCNKEKHHRSWREYLKSKCSGKVLSARTAQIIAYIKKYKYNPDFGLKIPVENLYQDVGAIAETLINLRLEQANIKIQRQLKFTKRERKQIGPGL